MHHGAHGKLKLFHLEDGGFNHQRDYKVLKKALTVLEVMNFNEEERNTYEDRLKWLMIEANMLKKAKEEGKAERSIEVAKKMLIEGIDSNIILKVTDLSTKEIEELKSEITESNK